ncbi:MAG: hypothetical protein Kow0020_05000 [Wenzhouxiangellaceae bacterium]
MMRQTLFAACLAFASTGLLAQTLQLQPPASSDLVADSLLSERAAAQWPSRTVERAPLSYSRLLTDQSQGRPGLHRIGNGPSSPTLDRSRISESRQYWLDADGAELAAGVDLPITAPGAVIRVSFPDQVEVGMDRLQLRYQGRQVRAVDLSRSMATGRQLRATGFAVPKQSLAFKLDRTVDRGTVQLVIDGIEAGVSALVHVFEPHSPYVGRLEVDRQAVLSGHKLSARLELDHPGGVDVPSGVSVMLTAPGDAERLMLHPERGTRGVWSITAPERGAAEPGALHELHAYLDVEIDGVRVRRDLSHAIAVAPALARLDGAVSVGRSRNLSLRLGIEAAAQGRYQLRGTLYGRDAKGRETAVALAESAAVLPAGNSELGLDFDIAALRKAGYQGPWRLGDLMLFDQGRMGLLEHRHDALSLND